MLTTKLQRFFPEATVLGLDIETTGLSFWNDKPTALSLSDGKDAVVIDLRGLGTQQVCRWLANEVYDRLVIAHNARFDFIFLNQHYGCGYPVSQFDTRLAEQLILAGASHEISHSLQAVALRRLGVKLEKDHDIRTGFGLDNEWTEAQIEYAANDALLLPRIYASQLKDIAAKGLSAVWQIESSCLPIFCEMERVGIRLDTDRLKSLLVETAAKLETVQTQLESLLTPYIHKDWQTFNAQAEADLEEYEQRLSDYEAALSREWDNNYCDIEFTDYHIEKYQLDLTKTKDNWFDSSRDKKDSQPKGRKRYVRKMLQMWRQSNERPVTQLKSLNEPINLKSNQQLLTATAAYVKQFNKSSPVKVTPPENFKSNTLKGLMVDAPDSVNTELYTPLLSFKKCAKLLDSFGEALLDRVNPANSRLHGNWQQIGTATGRPTCSKPNLLQMPADSSFRQCFTANPGNVLVVADFSQIELRIMAELSNDVAFHSAFVQGEDLHRLTGAGVFKCKPEDVTDKQRKVAKIINFATLYGIGPNGLRIQLTAQGNSMSKQEARAALDSWRNTYPQAAALIEKWGNDAVNKGYTATAWGRRRTFFDRANDMAEAGIIRRAGANHPIQGTNADITKLAMIGIAQKLEPIGAVIVGQIYDEIITEVPAGAAVYAATVIRETMIGAAKTVLKVIPVIVDCTISPNWAEDNGIALDKLLEVEAA
jgi:DNA polymerase I-like protein with 3'-5' exonuclease and polymerase domains